MTAKMDAIRSASLPLSADVVDGLRSRLRGPLVLPQDAGYDEARAVWNGMIDRRPAAIARCLGAADVQTGIRFAQEHGLPISVRGGGHNISGLAVCDGGLMLDLSLMRGVWVDATARTAHAQAGCLLGDVDRETQIHGLATVMGFVSNTGIAGLTLGGGFGYLTRRFGWTSDNVLSMDVVTADGRLLRASEREHPDLFWGLRGGGGNFGVVTSFEYRLHPFGPEVVAGAIAWRAEQAPQVLELARKATADGPRELVCVVALRPAPPAPWLRPDVHGKPIVALFLTYAGPADAAEGAIAPFKSLGTPVGDIVQRRSYASQQCLIDATQPKGRRYYWKSEYLPGLDDGLLSRVREHAACIPSPHSAALLFPLDGALNDVPGDHSPAGNRDARWVLNLTSAWERREDDATNIEWARAAWRDMRGFSTGGTYVNFLTEEESDDRIRAAYGTNFDRLAAVKSRWDPDNVFRANKNIAPRVG